MKRVLTAIVLIPVVLVIVLRAPVPIVAAACALVALLTLREYLDLTLHYDACPARKPLYGMAVLAFVAIAAQTGSTYLVSTEQMLFGTSAAVIVATIFFLSIGMRRDPIAAGFPSAASAVLGFIYIVTPLAMIVQLRQQGSGAFLILYTLIAVWVGDTVAYYTGRAFGRHKMAPRVSPGKTWEGAAGSFLGAIAAGTLMFAYSREISQGLMRAGLLARSQAYLPPELPDLWQFAVLSAVVNVAAQLGDLAESLIKRGAGVKDSGSILPGHGGMLDRIDALLFAVPVVWYYAAWRVLS